MKILRLFLALSLTLAAAGCGTKSDLLLPNGKKTPSSRQDPSKPTHTVGR
jgi:predicted small lipoprotein YifL